jgi:hypothetical protein
VILYEEKEKYERKKGEVSGQATAVCLPLLLQPKRFAFLLRPHQETTRQPNRASSATPNREFWSVPKDPENQCWTVSSFSSRQISETPLIVGVLDNY